MEPAQPQEARQFFSTSIKQFLAKNYNLKAGPFKTAQGVVEKLGPEHVEVRATNVTEVLKSFAWIAKQMEDCQQQAKGWSKENFEQHFDSGMGLLVEADSMAATLKADVAVLKQVRLLEVRTLSGDRRRLALNVRRCAKPLSDQHFWKSGVTWCGECVLGIGAAEAAPQPKTNMAKSSVLRSLAATEPYAKPTYWEPDSTDLPHQCMKKRLEMLQAKVAKAAKSVRASLEEDGSGFINLARVLAKTKEGEAVRAEGTLPTEWFGSDAAEPAGLSNFAPLWVCGSKQYGWRYGPQQLPFPGIGHFIHCHEGDCSAIMWPMQSVLDEGGQVSTVTEFFTTKSTTDFGRFMEKHACWVAMAEGSSLWVPFGWYGSLITTSDQGIQLVQHWFARGGVVKQVSSEVALEVETWNVSLLDADTQDEKNGTLALQALCWFKS